MTTLAKLPTISPTASENQGSSAWPEGPQRPDLAHGGRGLSHRAVREAGDLAARRRTESRRAHGAVVSSARMMSAARPRGPSPPLLARRSPGARVPGGHAVRSSASCSPPPAGASCRRWWTSTSSASTPRPWRRGTRSSTTRAIRPRRAPRACCTRPRWPPRTRLGLRGEGLVAFAILTGVPLLIASTVIGATRRALAGRARTGCPARRRAGGPGRARRVGLPLRLRRRAVHDARRLAAAGAVLAGWPAETRAASRSRRLIPRPPGRPAHRARSGRGFPARAGPRARGARPHRAAGLGAPRPPTCGWSCCTGPHRLLGRHVGGGQVPARDVRPRGSPGARRRLPRPTWCGACCSASIASQAPVGFGAAGHRSSSRPWACCWSWPPGRAPADAPGAAPVVARGSRSLPVRAPLPTSSMGSPLPSLPPVGIPRLLALVAAGLDVVTTRWPGTTPPRARPVPGGRAALLVLGGLSTLRFATIYGAPPGRSAPRPVRGPLGGRATCRRARGSPTSPRASST